MVGLDYCVLWFFFGFVFSFFRLFIFWIMVLSYEFLLVIVGSGYNNVIWIWGGMFMLCVVMYNYEFFRGGVE